MAYIGSSTSEFSYNKPEKAKKKVVSDELLEIIDQLRGGSSALESTPIVGSEGIGKTNLARNAYNNRLIVKHFHIRAWITVSQIYSWRGIMLGLLSSMNTLDMENISNLDDDDLFQVVWNMLRGKRYLIVLDDVRSVEIWDWLKDKIPVDYNQSRVLITSRFLDVACCVGFYSRVHHMSLMNADQSWNMHVVDRSEAACEDIAEDVEIVVNRGGVLCESVCPNPSKRVKWQNQEFEHP